MKPPSNGTSAAKIRYRFILLLRFRSSYHIAEPLFELRNRTRACLFAPGGECVVEGALARRAFFDRDDGAALVDIDQRHVEPRALLQELDVAGAVGVDIRQPDQEEAVGDLDGEAGE